VCNAALDNAFFIDPTIKGIIYSGDEEEGKYDDTSNDGDKDKDREDNGDEEGGDDEDKDKDRQDDKDEDDDAKDNNDNNDFYKRLLFDDNDDNSIDNAKYCVLLARGTDAGRKPKSGCPDKLNNDGMSEQEAEEALSKCEKDWKKAQDKVRRKSAHEDEVDDTITYTCLSSDLLRTMMEVKASPLKVGDTFPTKDKLLLRIVEEVNLYGVQVAIKRSDAFQVDA
jgi:hypothetical protein